MFQWITRNLRDMTRKNHMISKRHVATHFGKILTLFFRDSGVCFWAKLNLQTFRYIIFAKIFHKMFGAHPARVRLQASEIGRYLLQNRKFTLNLLFFVVATQDIPRTHVKYLVRARAPTLPNEAQKFRCYAHF